MICLILGGLGLVSVYFITNPQLLIVSMIGVGDLLFEARSITTITYEGLSPLVVIAAMYFVLTFTLSKLLGILERRLNTDDRG